MHLSVRSSLTIALLALALAACGVPDDAPAPAVIPPTAPAPPPRAGLDTAAPPTAVSVAMADRTPTARPEPVVAAAPTTLPDRPAKGEGTALADAIAKTTNVKTYRIELRLFSQALNDELAKAKDTPGGLPPEFENMPVIDPDMPIMDVVGASDRQNLHFTLKGLIAVRFGGDAAHGLEIIVHDGKAYALSPIAALGLDANVWYAGGDIGAHRDAIPPFNTFEFFDEFSTRTPNVATFSQGDQASIDGQPCRAYQGDHQAALAALMAALPYGNPNRFDPIQSADLSMWVCDDGYVHQVLLNLISADKEQRGQVKDFSMRLHLFDFERPDIAITAPANALPLTAPHREKPTTPPAQGGTQP